MKRRSLAPAAVLLAAVMAAGCSSAPAQIITVTASAPATVSPTPEPTVDGWPNAQAFAAAALGSDYDKAEGFASPRSAAARYLTHMEALTDALDASGSAPMDDPEEITYDAEAGTVTFSYPDAGDPVVWKEFKYDAAGKVVSWATGESDTTLSDRLWSKPAKASTSHANVELVSAYKNDAALWIVLDINAKDRNLSPDFGALLDDSKNRQREAADMVAPDKISKGTAAYVVLSFTGSDFGGILRYHLTDTNYNTLGTVKIKIR